MKFDLALDPSRDVVGADCGGASPQPDGTAYNGEMRRKPLHLPPGGRTETGRETRPNRSLPPASSAARSSRLDETVVGPPVLHTVVAPAALDQLLQSEAAAAGGGRQDTMFMATLSDHDTLVVPLGALVVGNLEAPSVHVQGSVHGRVKATRGCLVVDRDASVHGMVDGAGTVVVAGHVRATGTGAAVVAHGSLRLARSARVWGAVHYTVIEIYEGALVAGALVALAHT